MTQFLVKYCGNHSSEDLQCTTNSRADYLGVVFANSKRQVTDQQVSEWVKKAPLNTNQKLVGLFVNPVMKDIKSVLQTVSLDVIQLNGTETRENVEEVAAVTGVPVWKAIHHDDKAINRMKAYQGSVSGFVIDCKVTGQWGGTGKTFDWASVPDYVKEAKKQQVPCFIAGGIHSENVDELLRYQPDGIDLSSGIETNGYKDRERIKRLEKRIDDVEAGLS